MHTQAKGTAADERQSAVASVCCMHRHEQEYSSDKGERMHPTPQLELGPSAMCTPPLSLTLTPTQRNSHRHKLRCLLQMQTHAAENSDVSEPSQITTACAWTRSHAHHPIEHLSSRGMRGNTLGFPLVFESFATRKRTQHPNSDVTQPSAGWTGVVCGQYGVDGRSHSC